MSHSPSKEDHLAVSGLKDAQLLTLNSSGQVITRENMHPSVGTNGYIVKVTLSIGLNVTNNWKTVYAVIHANYASRRSRTRDTVNLCVCVPAVTAQRLQCDKN